MLNVGSVFCCQFNLCYSFLYLLNVILKKAGVTVFIVSAKCIDLWWNEHFSINCSVRQSTWLSDIISAAELVFTDIVQKRLNHSSVSHINRNPPEKVQSIPLTLALWMERFFFTSLTLAIPLNRPVCVCVVIRFVFSSRKLERSLLFEPYVRHKLTHQRHTKNRFNHKSHW